jgi:hypothetical protein
VQPNLGLAQAKLGPVQPNLGLAQAKVGPAQPNLGPAQAKLGPAQPNPGLAQAISSIQRDGTLNFGCDGWKYPIQFMDNLPDTLFLITPPSFFSQKKVNKHKF